MKNIKLLLIVIFATISGATFAQNKAKIDSIKIKTSAVCDMCKETIEKAMAYEKGVKSSALNVETAMLTVVYNPEKTNPEKIKKAVNEAGYDADELKANQRSYDKLNACCKKGAHKK
jgi:cation transport ATPase